MYMHINLQMGKKKYTVEQFTKNSACIYAKICNIISNQKFKLKYFNHQIGQSLNKNYIGGQLGRDIGTILYGR